MITNYDNDLKMAEYGRYCAVRKAIREAKELIRDNAVKLGNSEDMQEIIEYKNNINELVKNLIEAIELDKL